MRGKKESIAKGAEDGKSFKKLNSTTQGRELREVA